MYVSPKGVVNSLSRRCVDGEEVLRIVLAGSQGLPASVSCLAVPKFWVMAPAKLTIGGF